MRWIALLMVLLGGTLEFQSLEASPINQVQPKSEGKTNADAVLDSLKPILKSSAKVARIYYLGSCEKEDGYYVASFPRIRVQSPLGNNTGLTAIRDVFRNDANVKVSEGTDGIIRVVIGKLPVTILDTKISTITFDQDQRYTENLALTRIQGSKEVREAKQAQGIHRDGIPLDMSAIKPAVPGAPRLPASMINLTLDQALDSVAETFRDIVVYGACTEPRIYTIYYVPLKS